MQELGKGKSVPLYGGTLEGQEQLGWVGALERQERGGRIGAGQQGEGFGWAGAGRQGEGFGWTGAGQQGGGFSVFSELLHLTSLMGGGSAGRLEINFIWLREGIDKQKGDGKGVGSGFSGGSCQNCDLCACKI